MVVLMDPGIILYPYPYPLRRIAALQHGILEEDPPFTGKRCQNDG
jgi:hypothetical protein